MKSFSRWEAYKVTVRNAQGEFYDFDVPLEVAQLEIAALEGISLKQLNSFEYRQQQSPLAQWLNQSHPGLEIVSFWGM